MSITRKILLGIATPVLLFVVVGVFLPSTRAIEREAYVDAWPATLFALVDDAHRTAAWSPWIPPDGAGMAFHGPPAGVGAALEWGGARPGSRRIVESVPGERVVAHVRLEGAPGTSALGLGEADGRTRVRWRLELDFGNDLFARYRGLWRGDALARDLDAGLAALETLAENLPRADFADLAVETLTVDSLPIAFRSTRSRPDPAAVSEALGEAFFEILAFMRRHGLTEAGPPLSISRTFSGAELVFDAAVPVTGVSDATPTQENGIRLGRTYAGPAIRATHTGPYAELAATHRKIAAWLAAHGIERNGAAWEVYVSDPRRTAEAERVTLIYYPVQPRQKPAG